MEEFRKPRRPRGFGFSEYFSGIAFMFMIISPALLGLLIFGVLQHFIGQIISLILSIVAGSGALIGVFLMWMAIGASLQGRDFLLSLVFPAFMDVPYIFYMLVSNLHNEFHKMSLNLRLHERKIPVWGNPFYNAKTGERNFVYKVVSQKPVTMLNGPQKTLLVTKTDVDLPFPPEQCLYFKAYDERALAPVYSAIQQLKTNTTLDAKAIEALGEKLTAKLDELKATPFFYLKTDVYCEEIPMDYPRLDFWRVIGVLPDHYRACFKFHKSTVLSQFLLFSASMAPAVWTELLQFSYKNEIIPVWKLSFSAWHARRERVLAGTFGLDRKATEETFNMWGIQTSLKVTADLAVAQEHINALLHERKGISEAGWERFEHYQKQRSLTGKTPKIAKSKRTWLLTIGVIMVAASIAMVALGILSRWTFWIW